ncbi:MAG: phosphatidylglycerol lysyltransferase domain-containing protein [Desulfovibrio sp.]|nr:phosphatidylglycerol lysyltransferase domain-containing protein [Desulfovibrio sp.]
MTNDYAPFSLKDIPAYLDLLRRNTAKASDYSFANLWGWGPHYQLERRFDGALCWIRQNAPHSCYWAPVGPWDQVRDWRACPEIATGALFIRVPEELVALWKARLPGSFVWEEARGQWDYLYLASDLATLPGNRFHKKKNLLRQFQKSYAYEYQSITPSSVDIVMNMQEAWCLWRDCESSEALLAENDAVARVLAHWQAIPGLCGGIIRSGGEPIAYTLGEPLDQETLIIHFEKAANSFKGAYQAINWHFAGSAGLGYTYINREQDLDDPGLRQAKLSYNPAGFTKKYTIRMI